jgi:hypothetical protein
MSSESDRDIKSEDEGELNLDFKALFFGEALNGVADEQGLGILRQEVALEALFFDKPEPPKTIPARKMAESSGSEDEVETNIKPLYTIKGDGESLNERVLTFSDMYMPDTR